MKYYTNFIIWILFIFFIACSPSGTTIKQAYCTVKRESTKSLITCPDGSVTEVDDGLKGDTGIQGNTGSNGQDGYSIVTNFVEYQSTPQCPTGGTMFLFAQDTNRNNQWDESDQHQQSAIICNGLNGLNGVNGLNGTNGIDGKDGKDAPLYKLSFVAPCGFDSSPYKEVLLCLEDGSLLSSFSKTMSGNETRLTLLTSGSYEDTDDSGCNFTVNVDNSGNTKVEWNSGHNKYSTWVKGEFICQKN